MSLLRWVERRAGYPGSWAKRTYRVAGQHAILAELGSGDLPRPLSSMARHVPTDAETLRVRCRSDIVRLGKFDVDEVVRFRAFQVDDRQGSSSLRVQGEKGGGAPGVERDLAARLQIQEHTPHLVPRLLGHGVDRRRGVAFLREAVVRGRHPRDAEEVQRLIPPLVEGMATLYRGVGVTSEQLGAVLSDRFQMRWEALASRGVVSPAVATAIRDLVERDARVETSLGHGDLVRTNLLRVTGGVVLLDWEYARSMPVAFDLAKPLFLSADRLATIECLRVGLGDVVATSTDSYTLEEQLALGIAQLLSWSAVRAERAAAAGRSELLARDTTERARLLELLVS